LHRYEQTLKSSHQLHNKGIRNPSFTHEQYDLERCPANELLTSTNAIQMAAVEDKLGNTSKLLIVNWRNTFKTTQVTCIILVRQNITYLLYASAPK
jgi:hypothetical protein